MTNSVIRTCGLCAHWQAAQGGNGLQGDCCADVPFWVHEMLADAYGMPWSVKRDCVSAEDCDKFKHKDV